MSSADDPQSNGAFFTCSLIGLLFAAILLIAFSLGFLYAWIS